MESDQGDNPYQAPQTSDKRSLQLESVTYRPPSPLLIFVIVVAAIIASGIAFFFSCLGFVMVAGNAKYMGPDWIIPASGVMALLAFALTVRLGLKITRGPRIASASGDHTNTRVRSVGMWGGILTAAFLVSLTGFAIMAGIGPRFGILSGIVVAAAVGTLVIWLSQKRWSTPEPETPASMESFSAGDDAAGDSNG